MPAAQEQIEFWEHPTYVQRAAEWAAYRDLYNGYHAVLRAPNYLWMHELEQRAEGAGLRLLREQRSRYLNLIEPVISTYTSLFFKEDPVPDEATQALFGEDELSDVDGAGTTLESFLKGPVIQNYLLYSRPIVLTDAFPLHAASKLEEVQAGHRAFFEILNPLIVKDWEVETGDPARKGRFNWLRYEYLLIEPRQSAQEAPVETRHTRILSCVTGIYTIETYRVVSSSTNTGQAPRWEFIGRIEIPDWSEIPVAAIMTGESWIKDTAEQQLALFNLMSSWYNQLNFQAFQRLIIASDMDDEKRQALTEYTVSFIGQGGTVNVIEPSNTAPLENAIDRTINLLFKVAFNQTRSLPDSSKEAPGADTIREMKMELIALIQSSIGEIESFTNQMIRHYAKFKTGDDDFEGRVTFTRDITDEDVSLWLETVAAFRTEIMSILPWKQDVLKRAAEMTASSDVAAEEIKDEIDKIEATPKPAFGGGDLFNRFLNGSQREEQEEARPGEAASEAADREPGGAGPELPAAA